MKSSQKEETHQNAFPLFRPASFRLESFGNNLSENLDYSTYFMVNLYC